MQKTADFVKDAKTRVVISSNPEYYLEIKKQRAEDAWKAEINTRLSQLEKEFSIIKELLRNGRQ